MKTTNLRIPDEIHKLIKESGEKNRRSLNSEILHAIEYYLRLGSKTPYDEVVQAETMVDAKKKGGKK
jgi:hypothetical protein